MPIVVVERGNDKGQSVKLVVGKAIVFGRDPADPVFTIEDPLISRRHFSIASDEQGHVIKDLGSTNGTFLNDERVDAARLKLGDKIQIGETILSFLSDHREETPQGLVGKTVGGYKLLERVGRGGRGTVFKANQLSLNRIVAFKVLSARLLKDDKFIDRFKSEARAAGQLNHPNIVQVYDVGTDRKLHFFSMEFMDGGSLQDKIGKDGKLPWEEVLDCLIQASRALIFAERKRIVHRDVKPDNLMMTSDGQVKLADLGLARQQDEVETKEDGIFGTPHFISPEQAQGKEVDHRADLYSLGATAYRLLAGRTPFLGANVTEIITQQIGAEPPAIKQFSPETPEELGAIVKKLMAKSPDARHASAEVLLADLEQIRLKYHLKAAGVGGGGKGILIAVVVALLAVAGVIGFALTRNGNEPPPDNGNGGPIVTTQDPTNVPPEVIVKEDLAAKARGDYLQLQLGEPREKIEKGWKKDKASWEAKIREYRAVREKYPETEYGGKAGKRADRIEKKLAELTKADADRLKAATAAWGSVVAKVDRALEEKRFARALRLAEEASKDAQVQSARNIVIGAAEKLDTWLSESRGSIRARFSTAWAEVFKNAQTAREAKRYADAAKDLRAFLEVSAEDERRDPFGGAVSAADTIVEEMKGALRGELAAAVKADRIAYYQTYLLIRRIGDTEGDNPVFDFRFEDAVARLGALLEGDTLKTDLYRERVTAKVEALRSMGALMDEMVRRFNSGEIAFTRLNFPPGISGRARKIELNLDAEPVATREWLSVLREIRVGTTVVKAPVETHWDRFSPAELWRTVFLSGQRWQFTPEDFACAARFLAESGVKEGLAEAITGAGESLPEAERAKLGRELEAITAYHDLLESRKTRPPDEWDLAIGKFVTTFPTTDFFILVYGFDSPGDRALLVSAQIELWVERQVAALD